MFLKKFEKYEIQIIDFNKLHEFNNMILKRILYITQFY